jgi:hypothetical protein
MPEIQDIIKYHYSCYNVIIISEGNNSIKCPTILSPILLRIIGMKKSTASIAIVLPGKMKNVFAKNLR